MSRMDIVRIGIIVVSLLVMMWFCPPLIAWRRKRREAMEELRKNDPKTCKHGTRIAKWCFLCDGVEPEPHVEANCGPCACEDCKPPTAEKLIPAADNRYDMGPVRDPFIYSNPPAPAFKVRGEPVDFVGPVNDLAAKLGMHMQSIDTEYERSYQEGRDTVRLRILLAGSSVEIANVAKYATVPPSGGAPTKFDAAEFRADMRWLLDKWKGQWKPTSEPSEYRGSNQFCWFGSFQLRLDHTKPTTDETEKARKQEISNDWDMTRRHE